MWHSLEIYAYIQAATCRFLVATMYRTALFGLFALSARIHASMEENLESWFSLTFTSTIIHASRFNASGSIEITRHPASLEYQAYLHNTLRTYQPGATARLGIADRDRDHATSIFRQAIVPVTEILGRKLGYTPEYAAIFLPAVFSLGQVDAAGEAVFPYEDNRIAYAITHTQSRRIALNALGLLEGKHVGPMPANLNDRDYNLEPDPLVLVLEYEKGFLAAGVHEVDWDEHGGLFMDWEPGVWPSFGEQAREVSTLASSGRYGTDHGYRKLASKHSQNVSLIFLMDLSTRKGNTTSTAESTRIFALS